MTAKDILLYQVGNRGAIERVASSPATFLTGLLLVLITGIPRNYDQLYFLETWRWLYGPLAFSLVSGTWMYFVARTRPAEKGNNPFRWRAFMGLFWMTAPMAWIYAIPFERMLSSQASAEANLWLLALVSLGRVLVLSRVLSVLQASAFAQSLSRVLFAASVEVWIVVFAGGAFGRAIIRGMGGMRNAPEEDLMIGLAGTVVFLGLAVVPILGVAYFSTRNLSGPDVRPIPAPKIGAPAGWVLGLATLLWVGLALGPQEEQRRHHHYTQLTRTEGYGAALKYLSQFQRGDLPPQRRLRPSPYEYEAWKEFPKCFAAMDGTEAPWVAEYFRDGFEVLMDHEWIQDPEGMVACLEVIARLDLNRQWIEARKDKLEEAFGSVAGPSAEKSDQAIWLGRLAALGIVPEATPSPKPKKAQPPVSNATNQPPPPARGPKE